MGAATQVHPLTLPINRNLLVLGQVFDDLDFVMLPHVAKDFDRFFSRGHNSLNAQVVGGELHHARLNFIEILGRKIMARCKIVIEPILYCWTDRDLSAGE